MASFTNRLLPTMSEQLPRVELSAILTQTSEEFCAEILRLMCSYGYLVVSLDTATANIVNRAFEESNKFFTKPQSAAQEKDRYHVSAKVGYKKNKVKERFQLRQFGSNASYQLPSQEFSEALFEVYRLFDKIANRALQALLSPLQISWQSVLEAYCDPDPLPPDCLSTSVFNVYRYLNTPESLHFENCVAHVDPGFISILAKGDQIGLEITEFFLKKEWYRIEEHLTNSDVVVLPGETLQRLTANRIKGNLHRVGRSSSARTNLIYELRPQHPIWFAWDSPEELQHRQNALGRRSSE